MDKTDQYNTIDGISETELIVKRSRFIGLATSVSSLDEIADFLHLAKLEYPNASHYCHAYKIRLPNDQLREYATDAGEPTNSAGPPILSAIQHSDLLNLICVVVRYFGGIKLGVGGLIRAYGKCAKNCIDQAKTRTEIFYRTLIVTVDYSQIGKIFNLCDRFRGQILNVDYGENAKIFLQIRDQKVHNFCQTIRALQLEVEVN